MDLERKEMETILYALVVGSLIYAQVCTCSDIAYIVEMFDKYLSNPEMNYWKAVKWIMRYIQEKGLQAHLSKIRTIGDRGIL